MFNPKLCCLLFLGLTIFSCDKNDDNDESPPVLSIVPVDLSKISHVIPFGEDLTATQKNPAFEYIVDNASEEVRSCTNGYVEKIISNTGFSDFEIHIKLTSNSEWTIIYDHIKNVSLSQGDDIQSGTLLGTVGDGNRTELQLNQGKGENTISHCPFNYATADFVAMHLAVLENWCKEETVTP